MESTMVFLRSTTAAKSTVTGPGRRTPNSAARRAWCATAAEAIMVLVGMQPRLRQVPPSSSFSTNATRPCRAARSASGRPAMPPPSTRVS